MKRKADRAFTAQDMGNFARWYFENGRPFDCNMMWHLEKWLSLPIIPRPRIRGKVERKAEK